MECITSKKELIRISENILGRYGKETPEAAIALLKKEVLCKKIKFPLLEAVGIVLFEGIPEREQIELCTKIIETNEMGGFVIVGMMLQLRLASHYNESLEKAAEYMIAGDQWYVCDIIGERVMGYALLNNAERTIPVLTSYSIHPNKWIVRSIGVAAHYAVKKGLKAKFIPELFRLLLRHSGSTEFHTKKGIGWGVKTLATFHPHIIDEYAEELNAPEIKKWFKTKIQIGKGRHAAKN